MVEAWPSVNDPAVSSEATSKRGHFESRWLSARLRGPLLEKLRAQRWLLSREADIYRHDSIIELNFYITDMDKRDLSRAKAVSLLWEWRWIKRRRR